MTSTPAFEATAVSRPVASGWRLPLALYALAGFGGLLAEQAFEKYWQLLAGGTASASAALFFAYLVGFALGSLGAAGFIRQGRVRQPLPAFGVVELAAGIACILFSYCLPPLAPLAGFACLLAMPPAALAGAAFPLIAYALDSTQPAGRKRWTDAYAANLAGALAASMAAPLFIMPVVGLRGAMWICLTIGAVICALSVLLPGARPAIAEASAEARAPIGPKLRLLLAASFGSGAILFALETIWTHLAAVALGSSVYAFSWVLAAVLLGLLAGAFLANRPIRSSSLFQAAALLLTAQLVLWDRVPGLLRAAAFQNSFYLAEVLKLCVTVLLLAPPAALLGLIYPRLLASPQRRDEQHSHLAGYLSAASALGCLSGALLAIFVLLPLAGSEVSLKALALILALCWVAFLVREPLPRKRLVSASAAGAILLIVLLGRWWNWANLTSGLDSHFGQAADDTHYLPPAFVFKHEDVQGGFTTVVEQTVVAGDVAQTVRTLFSNGSFQGDDNPVWVEAQAQFGFPAVPSQFVRDYGRALLIGLGTGRSAAALRRLGYREISVAEFSPGVVKAAQESFSGFNEGILADPRLKLYLADGRTMLLTDRQSQYDLIAVERNGAGSARAANLYSREFYQLAHSRLRPGGVLQQWVQLHRIGPREIASQLATVGSVFPHVGLWYYGGQAMLVASGNPLSGPRLPAGLANDDGAKLVESLGAARLLDSEGVARLVAGEHPPIGTDDNRWMEYAAPQDSSHDVEHNLEFLRRYR